jgi:hypothetical protein
LDGDFNFDGVVDSRDLAVWELQYHDFGTVAAAALVPEPASTLLTAAFLLSLIDRSFWPDRKPQAIK